MDATKPMFISNKTLIERNFITEIYKIYFLPFLFKDIFYFTEYFNNIHIIKRSIIC